MKKAIFASALASLLIAGSAFAAGYTFTNYLKVGSTGADVTALQTWLVANGFLTMPAGVSTGYFGQLTKAAVVKYQASVGLPATGFVGPLTIAKLNGGTTTTTTSASCPAGYTCVANGSTSGSVTTVGTEGTILVTEDSSGLKSSLYEGDVLASVLGFKVEAKTSDALVQRVKVQIGTSANAYTKVFRKVSITDASGNVLASKDLNSSSVDRDSSTQYSVTLTGLNALVKKDAKVTFYVKFDLYGSISSDYRGAQSVKLLADGVRAQDGAGIDQYGPSSAITKAPTISRSLADSATLTLSTDPSVRKATTVVADQGSDTNEKDMETVASFRALAEKDGVLVRDLKVTASSTAGVATQPTAYLFDGSTQIASASASTTGTVTEYSFTSIDQTIAKDVTKTYTVKVDVRGATTTVDNFIVNGVAVSSAESASTGTTVTVSSLSTVGEYITFVSKGVISTLASSSININKTTDQNGATTEVHLTSTFNLNLKATGADAVFGAPATSTINFKVFKNGTDVTTTVAPYLTVYYPSTQPTGTVSYNSGTGFTVPRNAEVNIPVGFKVDVTGSSTVSSVFPAGDYSVRLNTINYTSGGSSIANDFSTNSAWVTTTVAR
jgi:hypothetical protein